MSLCTCEKWKANIDKIDAPLVLAQIRQPGYMVGFEQFEFCPWCGSPLTSATVQPDAITENPPASNSQA
jgi:hypothetical protein